MVPLPMGLAMAMGILLAVIGWRLHRAAFYSWDDAIGSTAFVLGIMITVMSYAYGLVMAFLFNSIG